MKLTAKELTYIDDLLKSESHAYKKAEIFASTLTDAKMAALAQQLMECHKTRFNALYKLLG